MYQLFLLATILLQYDIEYVFQKIGKFIMEKLQFLYEATAFTDNNFKS